MKEKNAKKVSIIVPVWNVSKYLRRCLDSCVYQTLDDIEIIVVNDFSPDPDDTVIMKEYEATYPNKIRCFWHSENLCLGGARNTGIKNANGEYIAFVDSDDYIALDMCERLYKYALLNDCDDVIHGYYSCDNGKSSIRAFSSDVNDKRLFLSSFVGSICVHFFERELYISNALSFTQNCFYEDFAVSLPLFYLSKIPRIFTESVFYHYVRHSGSIMSIFTLKNFSDFMSQLENLKMFFDRVDSNNTVCPGVDAWIFTNLINRWHDFNKNNEIRSQMYLQLQKHFNNFTHDIDNMPIDFSLKERYRAIQEKVLNGLNYISELEGSVQIHVVIIKMRRLINKFDGLKICVWGCGHYGNMVVNAFSKVKIKYFATDGNTMRIGEILPTGVEIKEWDSIKENVDIVIVCAKGYYHDIKKRIAQYDQGILVFDLFNFMV